MVISYACAANAGAAPIAVSERKRSTTQEIAFKFLMGVPTKKLSDGAENKGA